MRNNNSFQVCMTRNPFTIWKDKTQNKARNRKFFCQLKHELKSRFNTIDTLFLSHRKGGGRFIQVEFIIYRKRKRRTGISNFITILTIVLTQYFFRATGPWSPSLILSYWLVLIIRNHIFLQLMLHQSTSNTSNILTFIFYTPFLLKIYN